MPDPPQNGTDGTDESDGSSTPSGCGGTDQPTATDGCGEPGGRGESGDCETPDDRRGGIGRRRVLRTVVNAGYGAGLIAAVEGWRVLGGNDDPVPITYAMARDASGGASELRARTTLVPADWRDRLERSFELREEVANLGLDGLRELFVIPGSFDSPTAALSMTVADGSIRDRLLDRLEAADVDLDISILDDVPPLETQESGPADPVMVVDADLRTVPGGVLCQVEEGMMGTLAPRMYDYETGSEWFATSNHLFGARGTHRSEHAGEPLFLRSEGERSRIAEVVRGYPSDDVVRLRPVDEIRPGSSIYGRARVAGQFTRFGLALLKARGESLEKVGAVSGHTTGTIRGVDGITCYVGDVCKRGQLKWGDETTTTDGDSGSVNFAPDPEGPDDSVLVGGFNNARTWWPGANFAWGTGAHHLSATQGLHF